MLKEFCMFTRNFKVLLWKSALILSLISLKPITSFSQEMHSENIMPVYPGGIVALKEMVDSNLQYPEAALNAGIAGTVLVTYTIDPQGNMQNIRVMEGLSQECDAEAVRVTHMLNGWEPARRQGKAVSVTVSMPVEFKSEKRIAPSTVAGKVTEKSTGKAIEGAIVIIKGTNIGSVTDEEGDYRIDLSADSKELFIFSVGYASKEVAINFHSKINIELETEYLKIEM